MKIIYVMIFCIGIIYFAPPPILLYYGKISTSELITIFGIIPLSLIAIFQEQLKRWWFAPKLKIIFELQPPFCSKTPFYLTETVTIENSPVEITRVSTEAYYFRFGVINEGKMQAKLCEAFIAELQEFKDNQWADIEYFQQVNLKWDTGKAQNAYMDLNPSPIKLLGQIGHIYKYEKGLSSEETQKFYFDFLYLIGGYQPHYLLPNKKYRFKITVASENAKHVSQKFEFYWTGLWKDKAEEMFKEITIETF